MARVDNNPDYQHLVEKTVDMFDRILILDLLIAEGVQPGEVLRLVTKGLDGNVINDDLYIMESQSSFSVRHNIGRIRKQL